MESKDQELAVTINTAVATTTDVASGGCCCQWTEKIHDDANNNKGRSQAEQAESGQFEFPVERVQGGGGRSSDGDRPRRFTDPVDWWMVAIMAFPFHLVVACMTYHHHRLSLAVKVVFVWASSYAWGLFALMYIAKRPRLGQEHKVWVYQEHFVSTQMQHVHVWTWAVVVYFVFCLILLGLSMGWKWDGEQRFLGCRGTLWTLVPTVAVGPRVLAYDDVCCTSAFVEAAVASGYRRATLAHNFILWSALLICALLVYGIPMFLWVFFPDSSFGIPSGDYLVLYALSAAMMLFTSILLPSFVMATMRRDTKPSAEQTAADAPTATSVWKSHVADAVLWVPRLLLWASLNIATAAGSIKRDWRWMLAAQPHKFLYALGFFGMSFVIYPLLLLPVTSMPWLLVSYAPAVAIAVFNTVLGWRCTAITERQLIRAAENGQNIGSGIVFSVADLLNALETGEPLAQGFIACPDRIKQCAAISCRWDSGEEWDLLVKDGGHGQTRSCTIKISRISLRRAAYQAWRSKCRYIWMDTISVPQFTSCDSEGRSKTKFAVCQRLLSTMTGVYAAAQLVVVVETPLGSGDNQDAYHRRCWTLQECALNPHTCMVTLKGAVLWLEGDSDLRAKLTGLPVDLELLSGADKLDLYRWVMPGDEKQSVASIPEAHCCYFLEFVGTRAAACAADKAVALGQIFFRVLFPNTATAHVFFLEMALSLATSTSPCCSDLVLIDNSGWDASSMRGSADVSRYLMGVPGFIQKGGEVVWRASCAMMAPDSAAGGIRFRPLTTHDGAWLCEIFLEELPGRPVPVGVVADLEGRHLIRLRTLSVKEKEQLATQPRQAITMSWE